MRAELVLHCLVGRRGRTSMREPEKARCGRLACPPPPDCGIAHVSTEPTRFVKSAAARISKAGE